MRNNRTMMHIRYQHPPLGIIVLVLLCYSFAMSAAPSSSPSWAMGGSTTFRSTSTGIYRSNTTSRIGYSTGSYSATTGSGMYSRTSGSYYTPRANSIGNHSAGSSYRTHTASSATTHSYGNGAAYGGYSGNGSFRGYYNNTGSAYNGLATNRHGVATPVLATTPTLQAANNVTFTKRDVYYEGWSDEDGNGNYFDEELGDWYPIPTGVIPAGLSAGTAIGQTGKADDGNWYLWNGNAWVLYPKEVEPVGDMPWGLLLAFAAIACCYIRKCKLKA